MKKKNIIVVLCIILLIIFDQIIKFLIVNNLYNNDIIIINNFLKLTYITNTGAALGILNNNIMFLIIISILLIWYLIKEINKENINTNNTISLSLILSGALGNLIDRIFRGYVVDYISFTLFNKEMPIFNLADILITFGIIILLYIVVKEGKNDKKSE
jgi:signal peptidase II